MMLGLDHKAKIFGLGCKSIAVWLALTNKPWPIVDYCSAGFNLVPSGLHLNKSD